MANNAYYRMKVKGTQDNVKEFIRAMNEEDEYAEQGVGRVLGCCVYEQNEEYAEMDGDCAWSVVSAMRNEYNDNNIEKLSKRLNLAIEVYCEECGFEFQEHFCVINGEIKCDECIGWTEIYVEDIPEMSDGFWEREWIKVAGVTKDNYEEYLDDEYLRLGGYETWDWMYV